MSKSDSALVIKPNRKSSLELLRIVLILGVIIQHYNLLGGFGVAQYHSLNYFYLLFSESFSICAVDAFVLISGFYLSATDKRTYSKIILLLIQASVFNLVINILEGNISGSNPIKSVIFSILPNSYFVILYSVLYIVSPYINIVINNSSREQLKKMLLAIFVIFSIYAYSIDILTLFFNNKVIEISPISFSGSGEGYTLINFILMYIIGAYIRINEVDYSSKKLLLTIVACIITTFAISTFTGSAWNYENPFIIIIAACSFMFFNKMNYYSKTINLLARSTFTAFLLNPFLLKFMNIQYHVQSNLAVYIIHQLVTAVLVFMVSFVIYLGYNTIQKSIVSLVRRN